MMSIWLGIIIACLWASGDICVASLQLPPIKMALVAQCSGLFVFELALVAFFFWWREHGGYGIAQLPWGMIVVVGMVLGVISAGGYLALYFSLAAGPLAVVSPLVSSQGAISLIGAVLFLHEPMHLAQVVVLCVVLLGIVVAAIPVGTEPTQQATSRRFLALPPGIAGAFVALLGFGLQGFGMGAMVVSYSLAASLAMLLWMRCSSIIILLLISVFTRRAEDTERNRQKQVAFRAGQWRQWRMVIVVGLLDMGSLVLFSLSTLLSSTMLTGVLSSTFPCFTLLYGVFWRRERLSPLQLTTMIVIVGSMFLLSLEQLIPTFVVWSVSGMLGMLLVVGVLWSRARPSENRRFFMKLAKQIGE